MPTSSPTLSVVLATFNGEAFLEKQLESLAQQTRAPDELIVSDDGSTDRTNEIVEAFAARVPLPVRHFRNPSAKGFRDNFLGAVREARGDWIAFCDQDDIWRQDKLERCAVHMATPGVTQIVHQATLIDSNDAPIGPFHQGILRTCTKDPLAYDLWSTFWGFSMLVDRRVLGLVGPEQRFVDYIAPRHLIAHDRWAFFLAQVLGRTVEIAEPLVAYRQHGRNLYGKSAGGLKGKPTSTLQAENTVYITATQAMVQIVKSLPIQCERDFPAFERARAIATCERALAQLRRRGAIYEGSRGLAPLRSLAMFASGGYRNVHDGSQRWRSLLRDMAVSVSAR
ncbi:glycosyltransferase [Variovorax sp. OV329]|uniref:glycosyltransferase n=1 Tax=Variovorax sp. OV329 TaxID=1882825 RepID=UPI0008F1DF7C|nr:glycosyltransferase [Variovorax sp. OV329]SFM82271.1 Glycosyl transferase family 2 [Variovorax sp. OV329]